MAKWQQLAPVAFWLPTTWSTWCVQHFKYQCWKQESSTHYRYGECLVPTRRINFRKFLFSGNQGCLFLKSLIRNGRFKTIHNKNQQYNKIQHGWKYKQRRIISDAHFRRSPVIDRLKSQKTDCSNPRQDLGPIKIHFWWSYVPLFLQCHGQACNYLPTKFKPRFSAKDRRVVDLCIRTAETPSFSWSKWPCVVHGQSAYVFSL